MRNPRSVSGFLCAVFRGLGSLNSATSPARGVRVETDPGRTVGRLRSRPRQPSLTVQQRWSTSPAHELPITMRSSDARSNLSPAPLTSRLRRSHSSASSHSGSESARLARTSPPTHRDQQEADPPPTRQAASRQAEARSRPGSHPRSARNPAAANPQDRNQPTTPVKLSRRLIRIAVSCDKRRRRCQPRSVMTEDPVFRPRGTWPARPS